MTEGRPRAVVILDRYAFGDIARALLLKSAHRAVLLELVTLVDHKHHQWSGTYGELAELAGVRSTSLPAILARLEEAGLVDRPEPFGQGRQGTVRLTAVAHDALIAPTLRGPARPDLVAEVLTKTRNLGGGDGAGDLTKFLHSSDADSTKPRNRPAEAAAAEGNKEQGSARESRDAMGRDDNADASPLPPRAARRVFDDYAAAHRRWEERPFTDDHEHDPPPPRQLASSALANALTEAFGETEDHDQPEPPLTEDQAVELLLATFTASDGTHPTVEDL